MENYTERFDKYAEKLKSMPDDDIIDDIQTNISNEVSSLTPDDLFNVFPLSLRHTLIMIKLADQELTNRMKEKKGRKRRMCSVG